MEYNNLMKQAEDFNKKLHRTKDVNIADILTYEDRDAIADVITEVLTRTYGEPAGKDFKWSFSCEGYMEGL